MCTFEALAPKNRSDSLLDLPMVLFDDVIQVLGVIAECVLKRALSCIEERGARISQRLEPIFEWFGKPDVVAIEADVFPPDWCDVGQQRVGQPFALGAKLSDAWP